LLRAIQHGEIQRVGSDRIIRADVRILAATNRDLEAEVAAGRFRSDLFHRLAVYPIRVPPLRERREDIPLLAAHFLDAYRQRLGLGPVRLTDEARESLIAAEWPGNVRELENVTGRGVLRAVPRHGGRTEGPVFVGVEHLDVESGAARDVGAARPPSSDLAAGASLSLAERVDVFRRQEILAAVERHQGNWAAAARDLGLHRSNLHNLAKRLGLHRT
jgi:anaerobic nitric oxide reductase transcription regulator